MERTPIKPLCEKILKKLQENKNDFAFCMIFSVIVYSLLMANQLVNGYDGLWHESFYKTGSWDMSIGRWLLPYIDRIHFGLSTDPLTSLISLALFSIGMLLITDLYGVKRKCARYLACALFLSSTLICITLSYRYTSLAYGLAFFLSVLAAYMTVRIQSFIGAVVTGAAAIALSMGLYQPYLGCTCLLLWGLLIALLCEKADRKTIGEYMLRSLSAVIGGGLAYIVLLKLHLFVFGLQMIDYRGGNTYSIVNSVLKLPKSFVTSYVEFWNYFFGDNFKNNVFQPYCIYGIFFILALIWIIKTMISFGGVKRKDLCFALCDLHRADTGSL